MGDETVSELVETINDLYGHQKEPILVAFHGGEPLLFGISRFLDLVERIIAKVPSARLTVQSNGTIYNAQLEHGLQKFKRNLSFSLSLDGFREQNDRHRLDHRGRSRYSQIEKTITSARSAGVLDSILMVLDINNAPEDIHSFMEWAGARSYNLILRDGDYESLPAGKASFTSTEIGRWLLEFARLYFGQERAYRVQFFDDILRGLLARRQPYENEALGSCGIDLTIDTDGEIKLVDTLRVNASGNDRAGGYRVSHYGIQDTLRSPQLRAHMEQEACYAEECLACEYFDICGGGYIQHRWGNGSYQNPSIYCADYKVVFGAIEKALG